MKNCYIPRYADLKPQHSPQSLKERHPDTKFCSGSSFDSSYSTIVPAVPSKDARANAHKTLLQQVGLGAFPKSIFLPSQELQCSSASSLYNILIQNRCHYRVAVSFILLNVLCFPSLEQHVCKAPTCLNARRVSIRNSWKCWPGTLVFSLRSSSSSASFEDGDTVVDYPSCFSVTLFLLHFFFLFMSIPFDC